MIVYALPVNDGASVGSVLLYGRMLYRWQRWNKPTRMLGAHVHAIYQHIVYRDGSHRRIQPRIYNMFALSILVECLSSTQQFAKRHIFIVILDVLVHAKVT